MKFLDKTKHTKKLTVLCTTIKITSRNNYFLLFLDSRRACVCVLASSERSSF